MHYLAILNIEIFYFEVDFNRIWIMQSLTIQFFLLSDINYLRVIYVIILLYLYVLGCLTE